MSDVITCPSGLSGSIRGLTGQSMRLLSDKAAQRSGVLLDKILADCWQDTLDPGPYSTSLQQTKNAEGQIVQKPDWSKVLIGDRVYTLMQIRVRSFGPGFTFKVQCPAQGCRQRFDYELDMNELPVRTLSDEDRDAFANGNRLTAQLADGKAFWFRLLTGADEARLSRGNVDPLNAIKARIYQIDGLSDQEKNKYFDDGDISNIYSALAEMDLHDCGVETTVSLSCPDCQEAIDIEIPFAQAFIRPKRR